MVDREVSIERGQAILDVGCGKGRLLKMLVQRGSPGARFCGIDPDPERLSAASALLSQRGVSVKVAYAGDLPFTDNYFNTVISSLAFHHMDNVEKVKAVHEIKRVLKPGGQAVVVDLGRPHSLLGRILYFLSKNHAFTKENMDIIEREFRKAGLHIFKAETRVGWIELFCARKEN